MPVLVKEPGVLCENYVGPKRCCEILRSACLVPVRSEVDDGERGGWQSSVWRFTGLVEWSAVGLAERRLRSEDGRMAEAAGTGGWVVGMRRKNGESDISLENIR